ncbi:coproporphyrinogen 3 oxidase [Ophiostoma piceae UAMH 11346]|uniref:Coproporphyrinogen 3 oxidase n=1 Tax=Ophiostoma piceae (strain UAMH 11346) TaxID=1262450 RepID=S3C748_OPHP1|nr:coproporphyrinogen 3 oxidase [Ophiostoma piceae UAMH 11346]
MSSHADAGVAGGEEGSLDGELPAPRRVLADLVHAIAAIPLAGSADSTGPSNALRRVPHEHRALLATLHVLFPALLLPALDLLDRRRVVRFPLAPGPGRAPASARALYQIRGDHAHVVHLRSWHCTCAFFALAVASHGAGTDEDSSCGPSLASAPLAFSTPPCKHLLACLLADEWPALRAYTQADGLGRGAEEAAASPETLAGLVAGVL